MPRQAREHSEFGYMHLICRGIGKQVIFVNREDYLYYLSLIERFSQETGTVICAYCLMDNHVHLLVQDKDNSVAAFMQKLSVSYSYYFNKRYERSGHLFQNRYKSESIESEDYLITVFRYILNNPMKAGICSPENYEWSSYKFYGNDHSFVDISIFLELLGNREEYEAYIAAKNEDVCMEYEAEIRDDEWAKSIIQKELGIESGTIIQNWDWKKRNDALKLLKKKGMKIRQIERLTGINRGVIQKA